MSIFPAAGGAAPRPHPDRDGRDPSAVLIPLFFTLLLSACATARGLDEHVLLDPADRNAISIYRDQWVQRNPPEVHVQPASQEGAAPSVLFLPFRVTQPMDHPNVVGYSVARIIWQTWLSMRLFPAMEFSGDDTPYRRDRAVMLGRQRGADMVVGGFVTYIYAGGTAGDSQVAVQLEAHDTHSGQLVWSLAQSGMLPAARTTDYFLFAAKTRLPSDPVHAIVQAMAGDMGKAIQNWTAGPAGPGSTMEELDKKSHTLLFPPRDPVPPPRNPRAAPGQVEQSAF
jgi:hypothetical protein